MTRTASQQNNPIDGIIASLTGLGFSRVEASAYAALVRFGKMNGYQLAKQLKVSRPCAYDALESLLSKGVVFMTQGTSKEYVAEDPSALFKRMKADFCASADSAMSSLMKLSDRSNEMTFVNIEGLQQIQAKVSSMISGARNEILISGDFSLSLFADEIKAAAKRKVRIIAFSFIDLGIDDLSVEFHSPKHPDNPECMDRRIMIVTDFQHSLIASSAGSPDWAGTFSENTLLAKIVSEHIHHDIYLLKLRQKHGDNLISKSMRLGTMMEKNFCG